MEASLVLEFGADYMKFGVAGFEQPHLILPSVVATSIQTSLPAEERSLYTANNLIAKSSSDRKFQRKFQRPTDSPIFPLDASLKQDDVNVHPIFKYENIPEASRTSLLFADSSDIDFKVNTDLLAFVLGSRCMASLNSSDEERIETGKSSDTSPFYDRKILIGDNVAFNTNFREQTAQILFENMNASHILYVPRATLTTFAMGRSTSMVLDVGSSFSTAAAVFEGLVLKKSVVMSQVGSDAITSLLSHAMETQKIPQNPEYAYDGKGKVIETPFVSKSYKEWAFRQYLSKMSPRLNCLRGAQYEVEICDSGDDETEPFCLPDGTLIDLSTLKFSPDSDKSIEQVIVDAIFDPSQEEIKILNSTKIIEPSGASDFVQFKGVANMLKLSFERALVAAEKLAPNKKTNTEQELLCSVIPTGRGTLLKCFRSRLKGELGKVWTEFQIMAALKPEERSHTAFIGGSILACTGGYDQHAITREEYNEMGSHVIARKCP